MQVSKVYWLLAATSAAVALPAFAGEITGIITFEGKPPVMKPIQMDSDPGCKSHGGDPVLQDWLVLGEGQTVANVIVEVITGLPEGKTYPVTQEAVTLSQQGCTYTPHILAIRAGQPVKILNPDKILHNIKPLPKVNPAWNKSMPQQRVEMTEVFKKAEPVFEIKCNVHAWMHAYCAVFNHPFFDVTEKDGRFCIGGLEPGDYEIRIWHERLGEQTAKMTVPAEGGVEANFTLRRRGPE